MRESRVNFRCNSTPTSQGATMGSSSGMLTMESRACRAWPTGIVELCMGM